MKFKDLLFQTLISDVKFRNTIKQLLLEPEKINISSSLSPSSFNPTTSFLTKPPPLPEGGPPSKN